MTPEEKDLVERLKDHATAIMGADAVCKEAAEAIERLSAEVDRMTAIDNIAKQYGIEAFVDIERLSAEVDQCVGLLSAAAFKRTELEQELAAIRKQIAEAQPVAWIRTARVWIGQDTYEDRSIIVRDKPQESTHEYKPLYLHPAADAKDAERFRKFLELYDTEEMTSAEWGGLSEIVKFLDAAIDAAMKGGAS